MENCVFCKIIAGQIPSETVYEDDVLKVIADIAPAAPGHLLILPKEHAADITGLSAPSLHAAIDMAKKLVCAEKEALGADGVNVVQNNGMAAGQTVSHFHIHVIPRFENDSLGLGWVPTEPGFEVIGGAAKKIAEALKA